MSPVLLTVREIADRLKVSHDTAARIAHQVLHVRVGRLIRVPEQSLLAYLTRQEVVPCATHAEEAGSSGNGKGRSPRGKTPFSVLGATGVEPAAFGFGGQGLGDHSHSAAEGRRGPDVKNV